MIKMWLMVIAVNVVATTVNIIPVFFGHPFNLFYVPINLGCVGIGIYFLSKELKNRKRKQTFEKPY